MGGHLPYHQICQLPIHQKKLRLTSDSWQNAFMPEHILYLLNFYFLSYYKQVQAVEVGIRDLFWEIPWKVLQF